MISEIGTTDIGGDAGAWITESMATVRTSYPLVRAVLWYDDIDGAGLDFRLQGPTARALADPAATGTGLAAGPDPALHRPVTPAYLTPTTMESGPTRCSARVSRKPASAIQPRQSAAV